MKKPLFAVSLCFALGILTSLASDAPPVQQSTTDNPIYNLKEVDTKPVVTFQKPPVYPEALRKGGVRGKVAVEFIVDNNGVPQDVRAVKTTNPEFNEPAAEAVRHWRFKPGRKDGKPVSTRLQVLIAFADTGTKEELPPLPSGQAELLIEGPGQPPIFSVKEVDRAPMAFFQAKPIFPPALRKAGVSGNAIVEVVVDENGIARNVKPVKATKPEFGLAAAEAIKRWQFKPGLKDGKPVRTRLQVPINFTISYQ